MTKEDMIQVLRSVGVNENTVIAMSNAFDMGAQRENDECLKICREWASHNDMHDGAQACFEEIQKRSKS